MVENEDFVLHACGGMSRKGIGMGGTEFQIEQCDR
jgi:hypothetical protein